MTKKELMKALRRVSPETEIVFDDSCGLYPLVRVNVIQAYKKKTTGEFVEPRTRKMQEASVSLVVVSDYLPDED